MLERLHFIHSDITVTGNLILHIDKDTYEQLGLDGKPSIYNGKKRKRKFGKIVSMQCHVVCWKKTKQKKATSD